MEVHHHAHTSRKMDKLFLGVFNVVFQAEYQLEHKIEKDRGKQFIAER
ncbi:MAG TPA: hypothetical protein VJ765_03105 [Chitinophagaceae bacterium]|nr:hypothetical protein [Chitinophagaceae bacterium]